MKQTVPNFFIVGAVKSGSTSLYQYLDEHPQVFMSPVKEPHYFSSGDMNYSQFRPLIKKRLKHFNLQRYLDSSMTQGVHRAYIDKWDDYLKLFKNATSEKAIGEASTSYLWSASAAKKIKEKIPNAKIILVLRNPAERAFSHYLMDLKINLATGSFMDAWQADMVITEPSWGKCSMYRETGMYAVQVKRFMDQFAPEQIRILLFDEFKSSPGNTMKTLFEFLDVDPLFKPDFSKKYNTSGLPIHPWAGKILNSVFIRKYIIDKAGESVKAPFKKFFLKSSGMPEMTAKEKAMLRRVYEKDVVNLQQLIKMDLSHWLT